MEQASSVFKWDGLIPGWVMLSFPQALPDLSKGLILKVEMGKKKKLNIQGYSLAPLCISNVESKEQELVSFQGFMLVLDTVSKPRTLDVPGLTFVLT